MPPANSAAVELPSRSRPARERRRGKRASGKGDGSFQLPPAKPPGPAGGALRPFQTPPQRNMSAGAAAAGGRKGQDASYLLNFRAPERRQETRAVIPSRKRGGVHRFDKDRFLAANYRFVIAPGVDCSVLLADPDRSPEWETIAEVHVAEAGHYQCPICLEQPQAARMTQCGHVYCWPCLQRLWAVAGKPYAPCPICQNIVTASHGASKPAVVHVQQLVATGDKVEFSLMRREKGTITVQRASSLSPSQLADTSLEGGAAALPRGHRDSMLGKISLATAMEEIVERERAELSEMLELFISSGEQEMVPHVEACLRALDASAAAKTEQQSAEPEQSAGDAEAAAAGAGAAAVGLGGGLAGVVGAEPFSPKPTSPSGERGERELRRSWSRSEMYINGEVHYTGMSDGEEHWDEEDDDHKYEEEEEEEEEAEEEEERTEGGEEQEEKEETKEEGGAKGRGGGAGGVQGVDGVYLFYQASDGQPLFMHPLSVRALVEEYGSYLRLPHVVMGTVVDMERLTQSEELRKRHRCFEYLALSSDLTLAEIDVAPLVSRETYKQFEPKIKERRDARKKATRRDAQRAAKAEREERKQRELRVPPPPKDLLQGPSLLEAMAAAQGELSDEQLQALLAEAHSPALPGTSPVTPPHDGGVKWAAMLSKPRGVGGSPGLEAAQADFPALGGEAFPSLAEAASTPPPKAQAATPPGKSPSWGGGGGWGAKASSPVTPARQAGAKVATGTKGVGLGGYVWKKEVEEEDRYAGEVFDMEDEEASEEERRRRMKEAADRAWETALASAAGGDEGGGGGGGKKGRKQKTVLLAWG